MATALRLTIPETIASINRRFGRDIPIWKLRRVVDALESAGRLDVQRIGHYRTISDGDINIVAIELQRLGWITPKSESFTC